MPVTAPRPPVPATLSTCQPALRQATCFSSTLVSPEHQARSRLQGGHSTPHRQLMLLTTPTFSSTDCLTEQKEPVKHSRLVTRSRRRSVRQESVEQKTLPLNLQKQPRLWEREPQEISRTSPLQAARRTICSSSTADRTVKAGLSLRRQTTQLDSTQLTPVRAALLPLTATSVNIGDD